MARVVKSVKTAGRLEIALATPGLTPMLRAGVGGLAASLRTIRREQAPRASWPSRVELKGGGAVVEPYRVVLEWGAAGPESVLDDLLTKSFRIQKPGLVYVAAMFDQAPHPVTLAVAQHALKRTFLQHNKHTTAAKKDAEQTVSGMVDDAPFTFTFVSYSGFVHQRAAKEIVKALRAGHVHFAGWAYPGSAQHHIRFPETKWFHSPQSALAGTFAIAGTVQLLISGTSGAAIVIPAPNDLVAFAQSRPRLTPASARDFYVASAGDAALAVELALRADSLAAAPGCGEVHVVTMGMVPWNKKQKCRVATLTVGDVAPNTLDTYDDIARELPARIIAKAGPDSDGDDDEAAQTFVVASALRGFVADNLARGNRWYAGFGVAKVGLKPPRYLHYLRKKDNRGALLPPEGKALMAMLSHLAESETCLVRSVHTALRQRFGAIAQDTQGNPVVMKNRFSGESDHWRLKFSGAKTADQTRAALADLWSKAGSNAELQKSWPAVLDLLRNSSWQLVRDLALVALASYASREGRPESADSTDSE
jgi:CRISPR-associated protein Cas8a1/Csx13